MVRVCPPPRPGSSEVACRVDSGILIFWIGNLASKLAAAVSNCERTISAGGGFGGGLPGNLGAPLCAKGVGQVAGALGELAGASSMAAGFCNATNVTDRGDYDDPFLSERVSRYGDQYWYRQYQDRRLLIGEGDIGNGIQCGVDVGMVATNIANMGLAINSAVNSGSCQHLGLPIRRAQCTVNIGDAVAFFAQVVTFIQFSILNCGDVMNTSALCGGSIAGIGAAAASLAPGVASIYAGCEAPPKPFFPPTETSTSITSITQTTTTLTTITTQTSTTFTQVSFDCTSLGFAPLQLINRATGPNGGQCPGGSDIKQLDVNSGAYSTLCTIPDKCFNACGMKPGSNFIYCIERDQVSNNQLARIDCPAGGTGTACFLGKLEKSFSAGFNPVSGQYVETDQRNVRIVTGDVDLLPCSQTPVSSSIPRTSNPLNAPSGASLADILISDIPNPPAGTTGQWLLSCTNKNTVYIQNLNNPNENYNLRMVARPAGGALPPNNVASGAQWQWGTSLYCAFNDGSGVWQVFEDSINFAAGTIELSKEGKSDPTNSNDGLNCLGGESPFTTTPATR